MHKRHFFFACFFGIIVACNYEEKSNISCVGFTSLIETTFREKLVKLPEYFIQEIENKPITFSHKLHAGDLRIDCKYCHSPEPLPDEKVVLNTCVNCHKEPQKNKKN